MSVMTYDDLVTRLAGTLEGRRRAAAALLRGALLVVLVDEFQDTDPPMGDHAPRVRRDGATLVLIADQAGDLLLSRRRCVRLPRGRAGRRSTGHAARELAQRPGADRRP